MIKLKLYEFIRGGNQRRGFNRDGNTRSQRMCKINLKLYEFIREVNQRRAFNRDGNTRSKRRGIRYLATDAAPQVIRVKVLSEGTDVGSVNALSTVRTIKRRGNGNGWDLWFFSFRAKPKFWRRLVPWERLVIRHHWVERGFEG